MAQGSMAQGSMPPAASPGQHGPVAPQSAPAAQPASMEDDDEGGPPRSKLFYLFVGLAALALFFITLLFTVLLLR